MYDQHKMVMEFHKKFDCVVRHKPDMEADPELVSLRANLITEEAKEFSEAADKGDMVEMADALVDIMYVVLGAAISLGIDLEPIFCEVHRSNMTKVWPDGSVKRREDGKVMKPPTYRPPDIAFELRLQGWKGANA